MKKKKTLLITVVVTGLMAATMCGCGESDDTGSIGITVQQLNTDEEENTDQPQETGQAESNNQTETSDQPQSTDQPQSNESAESIDQPQESDQTEVENYGPDEEEFNIVFEGHYQD